MLTIAIGTFTRRAAKVVMRSNVPSGGVSSMSYLRTALSRSFSLTWVLPPAKEPMGEELQVQLSSNQVFPVAAWPSCTILRTIELHVPSASLLVRQIARQVWRSHR